MSVTVTNHDDILMINIADDANTIDYACAIVFVSIVTIDVVVPVADG